MRYLIPCTLIVLFLGSASALPEDMDIVHGSMVREFLKGNPLLPQVTSEMTVSRGTHALTEGRMAQFLADQKFKGVVHQVESQGRILTTREIYKDSPDTESPLYRFILKDNTLVFKGSQVMTVDAIQAGDTVTIHFHPLQRDGKHTVPKTILVY